MKTLQLDLSQDEWIDRDDHGSNSRHDRRQVGQNSVSRTSASFRFIAVIVAAYAVSKNDYSYLVF